MKIDHNFESGSSSPIKDSTKVLICALDVGVALERKDGPVPNWYTDI
jgi:hypothetical protein